MTTDATGTPDGSAPPTPAQRAGLLVGDGDFWTRAVPEAGVPSVELGDGPHGLRRETGRPMVWEPATCFPTGSALAATWDTDLVQRVGAALGREAAALGVGVLLGPGVNIKRTPLCGRNFEYFSEDPRLAGELGVAYVRGVQSEGVGACV
ncbi:glycoside hydrolase family 3 N-terminal domain-containing protein, partial [Cellulomonas sp. P4]|uniref:glycoside hydrolase family 3 N-terminal domain-containing protein n=1 Tax=Cellulomonas sp. P4 TaxID=3142533 RepID=UPI0031BA87AA